MKKYNIAIELDSFEVELSAKNRRDAKRKALAILKRKNITSLIRRGWPDKNKQIFVDEI